MPERGHRLPCPVCLGVAMVELRVGRDPGVEIDLCRRCGGVWLERGKVQRLRSVGAASTTPRLVVREEPHIGQCHHCHAPLGRHEEHCGACGRGNLLDCPACERQMAAVIRQGLRLDHCRKCNGTWFDHDELSALWTPLFDSALARREMTRGDAALAGAEMTSDVLFYSLFMGPDLFDAGATVAGGIVTGAGELITNAPEALIALPEVAGGIIEAVGEAAGDVFEAIAEIIGGLFN
ncbi:MAG TPA: zf-TFIIB domain-containing protein [Gemmatimonadales bacterium]|nr:zf-TFIIB domain-containing protein [Gemmatimonadales bacterium]